MAFNPYLPVNPETGIRSGYMDPSEAEALARKAALQQQQQEARGGLDPLLTLLYGQTPENYLQGYMGESPNDPRTPQWYNFADVGGSQRIPIGGFGGGESGYGATPDTYAFGPVAGAPRPFDPVKTSLLEDLMGALTVAGAAYGMNSFLPGVGGGTAAAPAAGAVDLGAFNTAGAPVANAGLGTAGGAAAGTAAGATIPNLDFVGPPSATWSAPPVPAGMDQRTLASLIESGGINTGLEAAGMAGGGLTAAQTAALNTAIQGAGAAVTPTALSAIKNMIANGANVNDILTVAGAIAPALLGAIERAITGDKLGDLGGEFAARSAPSLARFERTFAQDFDPSKEIPGYRMALDDAMAANMRALSTQGNPFGNPGGLVEAQKKVVAGTSLPAINAHQNLNLRASGLDVTNQAYPGLLGAEINAGGQILGNIASGAARVLNPQDQVQQGLLNQIYAGLLSKGSLA